MNPHGDEIARNPTDVAAEPVRAASPERQLIVVLTTVSSDAHTWNLVYLQLLLEELGWRVTNLGACPPDDVVVEEFVRRRPDLVVISSLNGHGIQDGTRLIGAVRASPELVDLPVVIGGRLDVTGGGDGRNAERLLAAGFDAVFEELFPERADGGRFQRPGQVGDHRRHPVLRAAR